MMSSFLTSSESEIVVENEQEIKSYDDLSRREVRSLIFHLLYAMEAFDYQESLQSIVDNFNRGFNLQIPFDSELVAVALAIIQAREELQKIYEPYLSNWRV